jgi:hypothetical protein
MVIGGLGIGRLGIGRLVVGRRRRAVAEVHQQHALAMGRLPHIELGHRVAVDDPDPARAVCLPPGRWADLAQARRLVVGEDAADRERVEDRCRVLPVLDEEGQHQSQVDDAVDDQLFVRRGHRGGRPQRRGPHAVHELCRQPLPAPMGRQRLRQQPVDLLGHLRSPRRPVLELDVGLPTAEPGGGHRWRIVPGTVQSAVPSVGRTVQSAVPFSPSCRRRR